MHNPLDIEQRYQDLQLLLSLPSTPYQRVTALSAFLAVFAGEERAYESYILECHERLPVYVRELPACGCLPERLFDLYTRFTSIQRDIPVAATIPGVAQAMQRFRSIVAVHFAHVAAWEKVLSLFPNGTDEPALLAASYPTGIEGWSSFSRDPVAAGRMNERELEEVRQLLLGTAESKDHTVLVPVVEKPVTGEGAQSGSLRRVSVRIFGNAGTARDNIGTDIAVYGVGHTESSLVSVPMQAVRQWLRKRHSAAESRWYLGHVSFGGAHELHEGGSSGLAVAAALACEVLRYENVRVQYRVRADVVFSGVLESDGAVRQVDGDTLKLKVEAAFFSPAAVLVLPRSQVENAEQHVRVLQQSYPVRSLEIIGIKALPDIFFDLRIMHQVRSSIIVHVARIIWGRKSRTAAVISTSILLVIAAWFALGPVDREPNRVTYEGDRMRVFNRVNHVIADIVVGNRTVENWSKLAGGEYSQKGYAFGDADGDGTKEVFYIQSAGNDSGQVEQVCAWSTRQEQQLWRAELKSMYLFPLKPDTRTGHFNSTDMLVADTDGDMIPEVFISAHHTPSFPGVILCLNARTGDVEQEYVHGGHISDIAATDLDRDNRKEIIACGVNNAYASAFVTVLDANKISGSSPVRGEYLCEYPAPANEKWYILLPRSIVGEIAGPPVKNNASLFMDIDESSQHVTVTVNDGISYSLPNEWPRTATLNFTFDRNMELLTITDGNDYEVLWDMLKARGDLRIPLTAGYLTALGNRLRVWRNGTPVGSSGVPQAIVPSAMARKVRPPNQRPNASGVNTQIPGVKAGPGEPGP